MKRMDFDTLRPNRSTGSRLNKVLTYKQQIKRNLRTVKARALKGGVSFEISIDDIPLNKVCPILGIPLSFSMEGRGHVPTIDKIRPELGYVPGNVRLISHKANRWKNDMSEEDAKLLISNWNKISA